MNCCLQILIVFSYFFLIACCNFFYQTKTMNNHLSVTSRMLVAFASGALIAVYFLPAWRIDLFAPQYPEGLSMYIWINNISGDVDIINGLNHYIGMKHISVSMFPEFRYLPFVVGFFMLLGMAAAITGKRKLLFVYVLLTITGGLLVLYDLYRWGYAYGHDLDPKAAIQVPGLSYQPPVIGHKRLLNFDAYSFPDVAGWIVFGAGLIAILVWFFEWYLHRKNKPIKTSGVLSALFLIIFLTSCSYKPESFTIGKDDCYVCKMGVADLKFGGEIISKKGKIFKFDDVGCMISYLKSESMKENEIAQKLVMNYNHPNEFLDAGTAWYLASPDVRSPMKSNVSAYSDKAEAEKIKEGKTGNIVTWTELYKETK